MEWINGSDIFEAVWRKAVFHDKPIDYDLLCKIMVQVARGLQYLHSMGILHRDIKPEHILVNVHNRSVLVDFDLAKRFSGHRSEWETSTGVDGTFAYMSPEVLQGFDPLPASDWYSLGVVLYECLTGNLPHSILGMEPLPPVSLIPNTPSDLNEIALALLNQDPGLRPSGPQLVKLLIKACRSFYSEYSMAKFSTNDLKAGKNFFVEPKLSESPDQGTGIVLIQGAPGTGKTRVAQKIIEHEKSERNALVLCSRCSPFESIKLNALDKIIDDLVCFIDYSGSGCFGAMQYRNTDPLKYFSPLLRQLFFKQNHPTSGSKYEMSQQRAKAAGGIAGLLNCISEKRHVVLFIDDFQWSDHESICILSDLLPHLNPKRIMLLLNIRDDETASYHSFEKLMKKKFEHIIPQIITLSPFGRQESFQAVERLLGKGHEYIDRVIEESGGIPYFINRLAIFAQRRGTGNHGPLLSDFIYHELSLLPGDALKILEFSAVAGKPLDFGTALDALDMATCNVTLIFLLVKRRFLRYRILNGRPALAPYHLRIEKSILKCLSPRRTRTYQSAL